MVVQSEIETCVIGKDGAKKGWMGWRRWGGCKKRYEDCWFLWLLCVLVCFSDVVVEHTCGKDCRGLRVGTIGTVG
jgi:hypothetical protein